MTLKQNRSELTRRLKHKRKIDNRSNHKIVIAINWKLAMISTSVGEEFERTCAKHFPETWFAGTHASRQNIGGGSETPLSFDLLHDRRRDDRAKKRWHRELRRRGRVGCYSSVSSDWRTSALYSRATATPWFDLLNSRNRPLEYLYVQPPGNLARNVCAHYSWLTWQSRCDIW